MNRNIDYIIDEDSAALELSNSYAESATPGRICRRLKECRKVSL